GLPDEPRLLRRRLPRGRAVPAGSELRLARRQARLRAALPSGAGGQRGGGAARRGRPGQPQGVCLHRGPREGRRDGAPRLLRRLVGPFLRVQGRRRALGEGGPLRPLPEAGVRTRVAVFPLLVAALAAWASRAPHAGAAAAGIPSPEAVLGFRPGEDRKLADW